MKQLSIFSVCLLSLQLSAQVKENKIRINQAGYYPLAKKIAVLAGDAGEGVFYLLAATGGDTVFKGKLGALSQSSNSSLKTRVADFTAFNRAGKYRLYIPGAGESYAFSISSKVIAQAAGASLKGFYFQRVSMSLLPAYAGK